jgi:tryptophan-rich sensory protein
MKINSRIPFAICIAASLAAGFIGLFATMSQITTWYATLVHPWWTPPNWVFGPVWTVLYVLMGVSAALVWQTGKKGRWLALSLFFFHLLVNAAWSLVFFGLEDPVSALLIIKSLWLLIVVLMVVFWRFSRTAVYVLIPYLLWVTYATSLNLGIILLN